MAGSASSGSLNEVIQGIGQTNISSTTIPSSNPQSTTSVTQLNPNTGVQSYNTAGTSGQPSTTGQTLGSPNSPQSAATPMVATDFRVRIAPLNTNFYGGAAPPTATSSSSPSSPYSSGTTNAFTASNGISNTGVSGTGSTGQVPSTAPGAANLLAPLIATNGVLFPYTPTINFEQGVDYTQTEMIQTNLTYEVYRKTPSVTITIQGKFTVQNQIEGQYAMAAIHFFRVASKMYFGTLAGANAGLPPPILVLNGYGTYMFNKLNCVLKTHSYTYADNVDTVTVQVGGGVVRLPSMFDLSVTLTVQQTPQAMRSQFNLDAFRTGALMQTGGWI